jgi:hypothetical protein
MLSVMKILKHILLACYALGGVRSVAGAVDAQELMDKMAGVYKHRFMSGAIVPGKADEPYQAEDVIRYMERLKASKQYKQAIEDLRKTEP